MPDYKKLVRKRNSLRKIGQEKAAPRKFLAKIILSLIVVGLIVTAAFAGRSLFMHFSDFKIKQVSVINLKGQAVANPQDYFRLDSISELNLFTFDMQRVSRDIRARHPELADVFIRKQFPDKLLIVIKERVPLAIIALKSPYLSDAEAFILPFKSMYGDLPKIIGIHPRQIQLFAKTPSLRLKKALNLLKELEKVKILPEYKISQIDLTQYSDITFDFKNRIKVKMGQGDFVRKISLLGKVLTELKAADTAPKYIDMRFDSPIIRP